MAVNQQVAGPDAETVARLGAQRRKWKDAARKITGERDAARTEAEDLRKQLEAGQDAPARVKELETQIRTLKHRAAFDRLAKAAGAKDKAMDTLFRESGYKADADEPDERAMKAALEKLRESHDFAFDADDAGDEREERPAPKAREAAPDAGRGKRGGDGTVYITREQLADPKWALDPRNAELKKTARVRD